MHAALVGALVITGLTAMPQIAAAAGPAVVFGTVYSDADNDGAITVSDQTGRNDLGLAGLKVDLICAVDGLVLASTTTTDSGSYEFGTDDLKNCTSVKVPTFQTAHCSLMRSSLVRRFR